MTDKIIMPKAGMAMEEGKIIKWLVKEGESVSKGQPLLEIETDKVSMEIESETAGVLLKILAQDGDTVPVTQTIGYLGKSGDAIVEDNAPKIAVAEKQAEKAASQETVVQLDHGSKIPATQLAKTIAKQRDIDLASITPSGYHGEIKARDVLSATNVKATPLARKIAAQEGVRLKDVAASGRIYSSDVQAMLDKAGVKPQEAPAASEGDTVKPLSGMRKTIASRMLSSHIEIPPVTMDTKADVTGLMQARKWKNALGGEKISVNDFVVQACAKALAEMPEANISYANGSLIYRKHVNIGVAVALDAGLIVPVIKDADRLTLEELSKSVKDLANKARSGKLMPDDYAGGTFTISNLGMYGITFFTPIINQPESMILGVCAIEKVLKMNDDGKLFNREIMGLSLTFDHRAHDGASAAVFLKKIVEQLEKFNELI